MTPPAACFVPRAAQNLKLFNFANIKDNKSGIFSYLTSWNHRKLASFGLKNTCWFCQLLFFKAAVTQTHTHHHQMSIKSSRAFLLIINTSSSDQCVCSVMAGWQHNAQRKKPPDTQRGKEEGRRVRRRSSNGIFSY